MISFNGDVPDNIKTVFSNITREKLKDMDENDVDALISNLKEAIAYRPHIKVESSDFWKSWTPFRATAAKKFEVYKSLLKIAFSSLCPSVDKIDKLWS